MSIQIYNTLSRQLEEFKPIKKGKVGLYTCGPTVYDYQHIGNMRTFIFEDVLKRVLEYHTYKVKHIMNITDVGHLTDDGDHGQDKMEKGAAREGKTAWDIAKFYTKIFQQDLEALNIIFPTKFTRATDNIKEQIALIKKLEKKGFTYQTSDGVYFDTSKLSDYGKLAQLDKQELKAGVRVDMGEKKNPTDFALWKFSPANEKRQMEWKSPWGVGFPGWHIECSAMAAKYLGQPFDIHCGGIDHVPVHHTNEIAQSEAANDKPLANYWMHSEFLVLNGAKMSKSSGEFLTVEVLKNKNFNPLAYRYLLLQTHYRKQLSFSWDSLQAAQNGLEHLYTIVGPWKKGKKGIPEYEKKFIDAISDDLDMPKALAVLWEMIKDTQHTPEEKKASLLRFDTVLALGLANIKKDTVKISTQVSQLLEQRNKARAEKNWKESDVLRAQIEALGYTIKDTASGTEITKQ